MSLYDTGFIDGVCAFAWWKDGRQHVGTTGMLLADVKANPSKCFGYSPPNPADTGILDGYTIPELCELIEAARHVASMKQAFLKASSGCLCHLNPPCSFCMEGGSAEIP